MNVRLNPKQDTKHVLIEAGMQAMFERGYTNTGIQEVLTSVGVPKGSFYHYFDSKEDFALNIIQHFDRDYSAWLDTILLDQQLTPLARLRRYCDDRRQLIASWQCRKGCLIGKLSQEMADQSEVLREALSKVMEKWRDVFAACISEGQDEGEIKSEPNATILAELFLDTWDGAVLRAKTTKSLQPIDCFIDGMFNHLLKA